jgi:hypothetical protein
MTVPNYKPVYRPTWLQVAAGASFWLIIAVLGWSFYKVVAG